MSDLDIGPIGVGVLDDDAFQRWLGESSRELFIEYLEPSGGARRTLLLQRFRALVAADESEVHLARRGGQYVAVMGLERQAWDSRHFGVECGRVSPYCTSRELPRDEIAAVHRNMLEAATDWAARRRIALLQRRLLSERLDEIHVLESLGFHQVDNVVTLAAPVERLLRRSPKPAGDVAFRAAVDADFDALAALTRGAFPFSRFVNDPLLRSALGETLYVEWLRRAFENNATSATGAEFGDRGIIVAVHGGRVVGYAAYHIDRARAAVMGTCVAAVELIVVDSTCRGLGIGQTLFARVAGIARVRGADILESSTWINQRVSMASNQKAGLQVREHLLTYHRYS